MAAGMGSQEETVAAGQTAEQKYDAAAKPSSPLSNNYRAPRLAEAADDRLSI